MAVAPPITQTGVNTSSGQNVQRHSMFDGLMQAVAYVVLVAFTVVLLAPFFFTIAMSLKTNQESIQLTWSNLFWPKNATLDAYRTVFDSDIKRWFFNSVFVAVLWVFGRAITASMAGYAFARMKFPGRDIVFLAVVSTMMVPAIVTVVPKFILLKNLGLVNTYGALTLPFLTDAFGIFLMKQFFESIPVELEEAARIDGASRYRMFLQVIMPNAIPAIVTLTIFSFQGSWNAFLEPLLYISDPHLRTLPLGLSYFHQANSTNWPVQMAMAVISTIPIALLFIVFQRYFVASNTSSGIKG